MLPSKGGSNRPVLFYNRSLRPKTTNFLFPGSWLIRIPL
ncbi:hypothetical protein LptCag_2661 [Leptospirillum ferriphilum]|uniref:Uncharacterized protein n=1 Tax=Leptospirillum ferriphilum TaxID=178606 RepID=A0A094WHR2_9BACT|nr:hypothetical protein LptCag_2661 [Leptospirillum ferriphilum]